MEEVIANGVENAMDKVGDSGIMGYLASVDYKDLGIKGLAVVGASYLAYRAYDAIAPRFKKGMKDDIASRTKAKVTYMKNALTKKNAVNNVVNNAVNNDPIVNKQIHPDQPAAKPIVKTVVEHRMEPESVEPEIVEEDIYYDAAGNTISKEVYDYLQAGREARRATLEAQAKERADKKIADKKAADEKIANEKLANEKLANEKLATVKPAKRGYNKSTSKIQKTSTIAKAKDVTNKVDPGSLTEEDKEILRNITINDESDDKSAITLPLDKAE